MTAAQRSKSTVAVGMVAATAIVLTLVLCALSSGSWDVQSRNADGARQLPTTRGAADLSRSPAPKWNPNGYLFAPPSCGFGGRFGNQVDSLLGILHVANA